MLYIDSTLPAIQERRDQTLARESPSVHTQVTFEVARGLAIRKLPSYGLSVVYVCLSLAGTRRSLASDAPGAAPAPPHGVGQGALTDVRGPRGKPCPAFLPDGPPSATPWCTPHTEAAGRIVLSPRRAEGAPDPPPRPRRGSESADTLVGITWEDSALVSFDAKAGDVIRRHALLDPEVAYTAVVYDRNHHVLYALPQDRRELYLIDATTLQPVERVSLRVDSRGTALIDTVTLAYDAITDRLYTVVGHWTNYPNGPIWSQLAIIDRETGDLGIIGLIDGPWLTSLSFSETDRRLYATGVFGAGAWDSPYPTHVLSIDPDTSHTSIEFETPYHTMLGFAVREPLSFYSWINWDYHFYGQTDLQTQTVTPMGLADAVGVVYAMTYKNFILPPRSIPIPPDPVSFRFDGHVTSVWDPDGRLGGRIQEGDRFAGKFNYDAAAPFRWIDLDHGQSQGISLTINGARFEATHLTATVSNNLYDAEDQSVTDAFNLQAETVPPASLSWTLSDPTGEAVRTNSSLPRGFDLSHWEENHLAIGGHAPGYRYLVFGTVDQVTLGKSRQAPGLSRPRSQRR